jgi:ribosomal protein L12E/L44/L45/RPP1/RPP2
MKKIMALMLGMAFAFVTVAPTFAQDAPKKEEKKDSKKKKGKKKDEGEKKGGR